MDEKNTYSEITLKNGETVHVTLSYYRLYQLKNKKPEAYNKYFEITEKDITDDFDVISIIYTAYLCANIDDLDDMPDEEEFIKLVRFDRRDLLRVFREISVEKKNKISKSV